MILSWDWTETRIHIRWCIAIIHHPVVSSRLFTETMQIDIYIPSYTPWCIGRTWIGLNVNSPLTKPVANVFPDFIIYSQIWSQFLQFRVVRPLMNTWRYCIYNDTSSCCVCVTRQSTKRSEKMLVVKIWEIGRKNQAPANPCQLNRWIWIKNREPNQLQWLRAYLFYFSKRPSDIEIYSWSDIKIWTIYFNCTGAKASRAIFLFIVKNNYTTFYQPARAEFRSSWKQMEGTIINLSHEWWQKVQFLSTLVLIYYFVQNLADNRKDRMIVLTIVTNIFNRDHSHRLLQ